MPALTLLLLVPTACAQDGQAVADLLGRMKAAVLAADVEAYLECVDRGEAEWWQEQREWAADLVEHTPQEFELALVSPLVESEEGSAARADLQISWRLADAPRRTVAFPAAFARRGDDWLYAGEAWLRSASSDGQNIVLYLTDDLEGVADRIIDIMPAIREHVDEGFETHLDHPQVIKLYTEMEHLQQSIYLSYTEPLGGWNEPGEAIKLVADAGSGTRQLRILLLHEYGHVATFTYHPEATDNIPWWVAEGVAELAAEAYSGERARAGMEEVVRAWAQTGTLAPWGEMADFRKTPPSMHPNVYLQGHHFVGYVSERFGRSGRNRWLRLLAAGVPIEEASLEAFGVSFSQLDGDWRETLKAPGGEIERD